MRGKTAVGIDDDFATGEARIAARSTDDELACWIDEEARLVGDELCAGEEVAADLFELGIMFFGCAFFRRLMGEDEGVEANGAAIVIDDGELAFGIGPKPSEFA